MGERSAVRERAAATNIALQPDAPAFAAMESLSSCAFVLIGVLLVGGCTQRTGVDAGVDASTPRVRGARCAADSDCASGSLCACWLPSCSVLPNFYPNVGEPEGSCLNRLTRRVTHTPVRLDGGWILEGHPTQRWFATNEEALEDPWQFEPDYELDAELGRLGRDAN